MKKKISVNVMFLYTHGGVHTVEILGSPEEVRKYVQDCARKGMFVEDATGDFHQLSSVKRVMFIN